ncbi:hypothetical protein ACXX84_03620 [Mycoplasma sp. AC157]
MIIIIINKTPTFLFEIIPIDTGVENADIKKNIATNVFIKISNPFGISTSLVDKEKNIVNKTHCRTTINKFA